MKIGSESINPISPKKTGKVNKSDKQVSSGRTSASKSGKDVASVSEQAIALGKARVALDSTPDVRAEHVQDLKQKIDDGTYSVPLEKLATILRKLYHF